MITTCSPPNFGLVEKSGADQVYDYADDEVIEKIRKIEPSLRYVFDTIGNPKSSGLASRAMNERGGTLCTVRPGKMYTKDVSKQTKITDVLVWTAFMKEVRYGESVWPVSKVQRVQ